MQLKSEVAFLRVIGLGPNLQSVRHGYHPSTILDASEKSLPRKLTKAQEKTKQLRSQRPSFPGPSLSSLPSFASPGFLLASSGSPVGYPCLQEAFRAELYSTVPRQFRLGCYGLSPQGACGSSCWSHSPRGSC